MRIIKLNKLILNFILSACLPFLLSSHCFADSSIPEPRINSILKTTYPQATGFIILDKSTDLFLIKIIYEKDWWESLVLFNSHNNHLAEVKVGGQSVFSAKFVKLNYIKGICIEAVGKTHMGNGDLTLFDETLKVLLSTQYYDCHYESKDYVDYHKYKLFKDRPYVGESISRIFRSCHLNIKYDTDEQHIIKIYGFYDYIAEPEIKTDYSKEKKIYSEEIVKYYKYNEAREIFDELADKSKYGIANW